MFSLFELMILSLVTGFVRIMECRLRQSNLNFTKINKVGYVSPQRQQRDKLAMESRRYMSISQLLINFYEVTVKHLFLSFDSHRANQILRQPDESGPSFSFFWLTSHIRSLNARLLLTRRRTSPPPPRCTPSMISTSSLIRKPMAQQKAWVSTSVLDMSREKSSEVASDVKGVSAPSDLAIPMASAVLPVPDWPASRTVRQAIFPWRMS
jgi:hypothetical protein